MRLSQVGWSLAGLTLPLAVAALTIPALLAHLGAERFGMLALAWGLVGYAAALDLGVGRAVTHRIAVLRMGDERHLIPDTLVSALRVTCVAGGVAMALLVLAVLLGVHERVTASAVPAAEVRTALLLLAVSLPLQSLSAIYRGVNEAYLDFKGISLLRVMLGVANFGGPYLVSLHTQQLHWIVGTLVLSRALALLGYTALARRRLAADGHGRGRYRAQARRLLLGFGGWSSMTGLVGALMVQSDRFVVAALLGAAAVTTYVIPYELTVQCLVFVSAVAAVVFPALSQSLRHDPAAGLAMFRVWLLRVAVVMSVAMGALAWVMPDLLRLWLGRHAAEDSVAVARILCLGVTVNAIGAMYFSLLHAMGATRVTGLLHLLELPFYLMLLWALIVTSGVQGCALAWSLRVLVDTCVLAWLGERKLKDDEFLRRKDA